ncbi:MAG: signal recognition particle-docking protein FtsY [Nanoarchaeota archaeon]
MFGFLKDKLKGALKKFSKDVEEEGTTEEVVVEKKVKEVSEEKPQKKTPKADAQKKREVPASDKKKSKNSVDKKKEEAPPQTKIEPDRMKAEEKESENEPVKKDIVTDQTESPVKATTHEQKDESQPAKDEPKPETEKKAPAVPKKGLFSRMFTKKDQEMPEEQVPEERSVPPEKKPGKSPAKKGLFSTITERIHKTTLSESKFEELFFEIEIALLENNMAVEVIEKIKEDLKQKLVGEGVEKKKIEEAIVTVLSSSLNELFDVQNRDILQESKEKKPYVMMFVGVNGSGKTTTLAKVAHFFQSQGKSCVMAACDTFRAAAIQQLQEHATRLDVKLIKHDYGADPAAVAFDAIEHAKAKGIDVVLIDTAGRLHSNTNLMDELKKIERVAKPDITVFVGESITGNDCVEQATKFNESVEIDAVILTKLDVDEKGGAAISVSYVTGKPIIFWGSGQGYADLKPFDKDLVLKNIGLAA